LLQKGYAADRQDSLYLKVRKPMLKKTLWSLVILIALNVLYFIAWPVPIEPVAWEAPPDPGYTGSFAAL